MKKNAYAVDYQTRYYQMQLCAKNIEYFWDNQLKRYYDLHVTNLKKGATKGFLFSNFLSRSAHRPPNFTNSEFQFPQFKVLQSVFFCVCVLCELYWHFLMYLVLI